MKRLRWPNKLELLRLECLVLDGYDVSPTIRDTMLLDKIDTPDEAVLDVYRKMRPSSPATPEVAAKFINNLFLI